MSVQDYITFSFLALSAIATDVKTYDLDLEAPHKLNRLPYPTRVDIRIARPRVNFDPTLTWSVLHGKRPDYSTTNRADISSLVSALTKVDIRHRVENINKTMGYTYHLLLFQATNCTVMHFRVFEPEDGKNNICAIYPVTLEKSVCYNDTIGPWLHARLKPLTNIESVVNSVTTNNDTNSSSGIPSKTNETSVGRERREDGTHYQQDKKF